MAATMVMVVSLVMVLSLVLVLLAELYCSLLLRRRRHHNSHNLPITTTTVSAATTLNQVISTTSNEHSPSPTPSNIDSLSNPLYTGVLQTPTKTPSLQASLDLIQETTVNDSSNHNNKSTTASSLDNFIYISNPIYSTSKQTTPFETPQSSPSRLEDEEDDTIQEEVSTTTPTLSPMKDLPEKACSVSLKDIETSPSESKNNNNGESSSSSSSGSPYTSPSW
ncbi:hypothetical protein CARUB_v10018686mg [Capsella rubella]|uniref:Uncharacterized protein n=2 Tax=Capsella rubella TaxID=81985 RepID=R0FSG1_9BRAS|nr:hypothetical protein CARUB_v10018686mg [Capsella rubella]